MPIPTAGRTVQRTRPAIAVTVACIALFTDMLIYGLAIPVLPLLPHRTMISTDPGESSAGGWEPGTSFPRRSSLDKGLRLTLCERLASRA